MTEKQNLDFVVINTDNQPVIYASRENDRIQDELLSFLFQRDTGGVIIADTDDYEIVKSDPAEKGGRGQGQHLKMWGDLSDDYSFIISTPVESLEAAASLTNRFMLETGLIVLVLAVLIAWFAANRLSRPIRQLAELSTRMSDLDFDARYTGTEVNEIGILGQSFNQMSDELEKKVSELKNANYSMQKDLDRRSRQEAMHKEFIGNIAHELKTPIAVISGYAEGLKEGVACDEQSRSDYCDVIIDETRRMDQIIHNICKSLPSGWIQHKGKASCSPDRSHVVELQLTWRSFITLNLNSYEVTIDAGQYVRDPYSGVFVGKKLNLPASGILYVFLDPIFEKFLSHLCSVSCVPM